MKIDKSDVQEILVHLYLRLNGYFVSGFIAHAARGVRTEIDVIAVRFPMHKEPEREIDCSEYLSIPVDKVDFLVGEVKGGSSIKFNTRFRNNQEAIRNILQRFGAFDSDEISRATANVSGLLDPSVLRRNQAFPSMELKCSTSIGSQLASLRFILFAAGKTREVDSAKYCIMQDDMVNFIWKCFRPDGKRDECDDRYNFELWGPQFNELVRCFKNKELCKPPTLNEIYAAYEVLGPQEV